MTLGVLVTTTTLTATMLIWPQFGIGEALERSPAILAGEWWRIVSTLLVMTDGSTQIIANTIGLLVFGSLVEYRFGPIWWSLAYIVAGLAGEIAGIFWQPVGGGNSVAICGLIGLFSIGQIEQKGAPFPLRYFSAIFWLGLGLWLVTLSDIHGPALTAGFALAGTKYLIDARRTA